MATELTLRQIPDRNRKISGGALGFVVVEADLCSGSLITIRLAKEQGRAVGAVPGSPLDPHSQGTSDLLRQRAVLIERVEDMNAAIQGMAPAPRKGPDPITASADPTFVETDVNARPLLAAQLS